MPFRPGRTITRVGLYSLINLPNIPRRRDCYSYSHFIAEVMEAQGGKATCTGLQGHAVAEPLLNSVPSCVCVRI